METQVKVNNLWDYAIPNGNVPQLPSWVIDPNSDHAASDCERDMVLYFTKQYMGEMNVTQEEAASWIEPDRMRLLAEGTIRAIETLSSMEDLSQRALHSVALKAMKAQLHAYDKSEPQTFEDFLYLRLGSTKSRGTKSETVFFLEVLAYYENHGLKQYVEDLFKSREGFAKLTKCVKDLRKTFGDLRSAEKNYEEITSLLGKKIQESKTEEEREGWIAQMKEADSAHQEGIKAIQDTFNAKLEAAVEFSRDPNIDIEFLPEIIASVDADHPRGTAEKPAKLMVAKAATKDGICYLITVRPEGEGMVDRAISNFADTYSSTPYKMIEELSKHLTKKETE